MGSGTEHAKLIDDMKDQLLIVLLKKVAVLSGDTEFLLAVDIPVSEVDGTSNYLVSMAVRGAHGLEMFHFEVSRKN